MDHFSPLSPEQNASKVNFSVADVHKTSIRTHDLISGLLPFTRVSDGSLARLAGTVCIVEVRRGALVSRRGSPCTGMHVVVSGQIKLCLQAAEGSERVLALLGRGQTFGESTMFLGLDYSVTAQALVDSRVLHLPKPTVVAEIGRDPEFAHNVIHGLSCTLNYMIRKFEGVTLRSGVQRVVDYLLNVLSGQGHDNRAIITLPARKGLIASDLSLSHEHFSRILKELTAKGIIEVCGQVVHILDIARLRRYAI